jgi:cytochrome b561
MRWRLARRAYVTWHVGIGPDGAEFGCGMSRDGRCRSGKVGDTGIWSASDSIKSNQDAFQDCERRAVTSSDITNAIASDINTDIATAPAGADVPRYDRAARWFHWVTAALVLTALPIGLYCSFLVPGTPDRRFLLEIHKSLGLTALWVIAFRVLYRLCISAPPYERPLGGFVHLTARAAHIALYAIILIMPLTGYVYSAAGGYSLPWFGLFQWPRLLAHDKAVAELSETLHGYGAYALYVLIAAHLGAVVWHRFIVRDSVLARMLPPRR